MRIATWNVNSVKQRVPRLLPWLDERKPDVVCLQETKLTDDAFGELLGEELALARLRGRRPRRDGVERRRDPLPGRIRGRRQRHPRRAGLPGPGGTRGHGARAAASASRACTCPTAVRPDSEHYAYKLEWLAALRELVAAGPDAAVVLGDMNIAPTDEDVFDPAAYVGQTHVTQPEREALAALQARRPARRRPRPLARRARVHLLGLPRRHVPQGPGHADRPRRSRASRSPSARKAAWIDRQARKGTGPSDHAPVMLDLDEAPDGDIGPMVPPPSAKPAKPGSHQPQVGTPPKS